MCWCGQHVQWGWTSIHARLSIYASTFYSCKHTHTHIRVQSWSQQYLQQLHLPWLRNTHTHCTRVHSPLMLLSALGGFCPVHNQRSKLISTWLLNNRENTHGPFTITLHRTQNKTGITKLSSITVHIHTYIHTYTHTYTVYQTTHAHTSRYGKLKAEQHMNADTYLIHTYIHT